jgi:hypothetical protein
MKDKRKPESHFHSDKFKKTTSTLDLNSDEKLLDQILKKVTPVKRSKTAKADGPISCAAVLVPRLPV